MKCLAHLIPIFLGSIITARKNCLNLYLKGDTQRPMLQLQWMPELLDHHASPRIFCTQNNSNQKYFSSTTFNPPFSYIISPLQYRVSQKMTLLEFLKNKSIFIWNILIGHYGNKWSYVVLSGTRLGGPKRWSDWSKLVLYGFIFEKFQRGIFWDTLYFRYYHIYVL